MEKSAAKGWLFQKTGQNMEKSAAKGWFFQKTGQIMEKSAARGWFFQKTGQNMEKWAAKGWHEAINGPQEAAEGQQKPPSPLMLPWRGLSATQVQATCRPGAGSCYPGAG